MAASDSCNGQHALGAGLSGQRKKTVAFYEVVRAKDAGNIRFDRIDWGFVLDNLRALSVHERHMMHDVDVYVGEPIDSSNGEHLVLARLRDGDLQQMDYEAQRIDALRLDGKRSVVATTIICFHSPMYRAAPCRTRVAM
ncbi:hypothetical protein ACIBSR_09075 [Streptomyces sp. NPDC049936]|uniref:hypothetical protein n=1 Tax=Streptomyces sp. NPDC049936 TaxID=3365599 RepID=UPI0037A4B4D2